MFFCFLLSSLLLGLFMYRCYDCMDPKEDM